MCNNIINNIDDKYKFLDVKYEIKRIITNHTDDNGLCSLKKYTIFRYFNENILPIYNEKHRIDYLKNVEGIKDPNLEKNAILSRRKMERIIDELINENFISMDENNDIHLLVKKENNLLIPYHFNEDNEPVVNARDLHTFLMIGQEFSNWIKSRIKKGMFVKGRDYLIKLVPSFGGRPRTEYFLNNETTLSIIQMDNGKKSNEIRKIISKNIMNHKIILNAIKDFDVPDELEDMFIYVIQEQDTGNIKIGISKDPEKRLRQFQTGNSSELKLIYSVKAKDRYKTEKQIHQQNKINHIIGEWFNKKSRILMENTRN